MPVLFGFTLALVWVGELVCRPDFVAFRVFLRCVCVCDCFGFAGERMVPVCTLVGM